MEHIQLMVTTHQFTAEQQFMSLQPYITLKTYILQKEGGAMVHYAMTVRGLSYQQIVPELTKILTEKNGIPVEVKKNTLKKYMVDWRKQNRLAIARAVTSA